MSGLEVYQAALKDIQELFLEKNSQYGDSAFDVGIFGETRWWLRLSDIRRKTTRLEALTASAARGNEEAQAKLIDDYKDLANYAIIAVAVLENQK